jgi:xanthine dehydrogenase accessory factor
VKASDRDIFEELAAALRRGGRAALATLVAVEGSAPRHSGARMLVFEGGRMLGTVGGGILEKRVMDDALALMDEAAGGPGGPAGGACRLLRYDLTAEETGGIGAACGGRTDVFIEVFGQSRKILICGAGHVGLALARVAAEAGFGVVVADDRPEFTSAEKFPEGVRVLTVKPDDASLLGEITPGAAVVIVTRGHALDRDALRRFAASPAFYVGMIGSRRKVGRVLAELEKDGVDAHALARVFTPIGLDIGAETPEEIAVAILAEIIAVQRSGAASAVSMMHKR